MNWTIEVVKEIRFAVVMYGGVSLAIYINGVAQEFLRMVRATAINNDANAFRFENDSPVLDAVEELYRDLSFLLADEDLLNDGKLLAKYKSWLGKRRRADAQRNPLRERLQQKADGGETIKIVRFVTDVLSGSSAGGINGIYLAKALAAGQDIRKLEMLWKKEGNFAKLLNDEKSLEDTGANENGGKNLRLSNVSSLLNSERMYWKLFDAFRQMDEQPVAASFVDEIDLFVTTTDYWGVPVPIRLYDQLIHERRHRQVMRFKHRSGESDFADNYAFLAYSARCTSSFPFAFEPMKMADANRIFAEKGLPAIVPDIYERFLKPVVIEGENAPIPINWEERTFVDGGYLDNKPFGYAIEALGEKQSNVLVDRKLIYVEPEPDADDYLQRAQERGKPPILANTLAALTDLPRYETIREDLQQVLARNRLIVRVNNLIANARKDEHSSLRLSLARLNDIAAERRALLADLRGKNLLSANGEPVWEKLTLGELAQQKGQGIYSYYRLRVSSVTDDFARLVTRRAGLDENSDYFLAVRDLVRVWRKENFDAGESYIDDAAQTQNVKTLPQFLTDYDYNYRLRRLRFVLQQADRLLLFDQTLSGELELTGKTAAEFRTAEARRINKQADDARAFQTEFSLVENGVFNDARTASEIIFQANAERREHLRRIVRIFKEKLNQILNDFKRRLRELETPNENAAGARTATDLGALDQHLAAIKAQLNIADLKRLLGESETENQFDTDFDLDARLNRAQKFLNSAENQTIRLAVENLGGLLQKIFNDAADETRSAPESIFGAVRAEAKSLLSAVPPDLRAQAALTADLSERFGGNSAEAELLDAVRNYLRHFYENFDAYDQILFPVTFETPIGEGVAVDVARISPLDAPSLIDENAEKKREAADKSKKYQAKRKVAGGVFRAFGAFFAEDWRKNDILWGRLDAAERLVSVVFQPHCVPPLCRGLRKEIIEEIQEAILIGDAELGEDGLMQTVCPSVCEQTDESSERKYIRFVRNDYRVDHQLPEADVFDTASRSFAVLQKALKEDELGAANRVKDIALEAFNLFVRQNVQRKDVTDFIEAQLNPYLKYVVAAFVAPVALLALAIGLFFAFGKTWLLIAGLSLATLVLALIFAAAYWLVKTKWLAAQEAIARTIMKNVTGGD